MKYVYLDNAASTKVDEKVLNVSGDFADKMEKKVESLIQEACLRAKANGRNTVMAKDL